MFVELGNLHGTSSYVVYLIHGGKQTPEEGRRTYRPKRCGNNKKDKDNSPKTLNDKKEQASSQNFRQLKGDMFVEYG